MTQDAAAPTAMKRSASDMSPGLSTEYPKPPHSKNADKRVDYFIDVLIVGAGPAGLMLATQLSRFGIPVKIIDERAAATPAGRADGLQPHTIETFRAMGIAEPLLRRGVKVYDISFWNSTPESPVLKRSGRDMHYPPVVDVLDPYILLVHQGMVEQVFIDDCRTRGVEVERRCVFDSCTVIEGGDDEKAGEWPVEAVYKDEKEGEGEVKRVRAKYVIGCDGAHSAVRRSMEGVEMQGETSDVFWGVLDGVIDTDFPDLWSKCAISSHTAGTILCCPRERNMTRLYIELTPTPGAKKVSRATASISYIQSKAAAILAPYRVSWTTVDWFGVYSIGQRVASHFSSSSNRILIAGDAGHTHSPKVAQGMNVSMADTFNLAWKLAHVLQGRASHALLDTYATERRKIATDLIAFDRAHARALMKRDIGALVDNFKTNIRFISGVGAVYGSNVLNLLPTPSSSLGGVSLIPGVLLPPARATRWVDANPVDLTLDVPARLPQFRVYFLAPDFAESKYFLDVVCELFSSPGFPLCSPPSPPPAPVPASVLQKEDPFDLTPRYAVAGSSFYTPALITATPHVQLELSDLPPLLRKAKWCVYLDNLEAQTSPLRRKWSRARIRIGETQVVVVRPDGYVGAVSKPYLGGEADEAGRWVGAYFSAFVKGFEGWRRGREREREKEKEKGKGKEVEVEVEVVEEKKFDAERRTEEVETMVMKEVDT